MTAVVPFESEVTLLLSADEAAALMAELRRLSDHEEHQSSTRTGRGYGQVRRESVARSED